MTKEFTWTSEPGLILEGSHFKTTHETIMDEKGNYINITSHWGNPCDGSCAWYFVPPKEKVRLEAEGAIFGHA